MSGVKGCTCSGDVAEPMCAVCTQDFERFVADQEYAETARHALYVSHDIRWQGRVKLNGNARPNRTRDR